MGKGEESKILIFLQDRQEKEAELLCYRNSKVLDNEYVSTELCTRLSEMSKVFPHQGIYVMGTQKQAWPGRGGREMVSSTGLTTAGKQGARGY